MEDRSEKLSVCQTHEEAFIAFCSAAVCEGQRLLCPKCLSLHDKKHIAVLFADFEKEPKNLLRLLSLFQVRGLPEILEDSRLIEGMINRHLDMLIETLISHVEDNRSKVKEILTEASSKRMNVITSLNAICNSTNLRQLLAQSDFQAFSAALDLAFKETDMKLIEQNAEEFHTINSRLKVLLSEEHSKEVVSACAKALSQYQIERPIIQTVPTLLAGENVLWGNGQKSIKLTTASKTSDLIITTQALQPPFSLKVTLGELHIQKPSPKPWVPNELFRKNQTIALIGLTDAYTAVPVAGGSLRRNSSLYFYHQSLVYQAIYLEGVEKNQLALLKEMKTNPVIVFDVDQESNATVGINGKILCKAQLPSKLPIHLFYCTTNPTYEAKILEFKTR
eukprot:TRINITY_DN11298_c0_g1_i1.p1 TRINITY_DN11298_c0_g1~~TRINITY_DN11298_c0_g1_i1.p1  ORF type:complete len:392 (-),score=65.25 TRINITY_DN11298_c0_g1_i1:50-1225(-)